MLQKILVSMGIILSFSSIGANATDHNTLPAHQFFQDCLDGNLDSIVKYVEINQQDPYIVDFEGRTGLIYAIWGNKAVVAKYLMTAAPGIHLILSEYKTSALQIAVNSNDVTLVKNMFEGLNPQFLDYQYIATKTLPYLEQSFNHEIAPIKQIAEQSGNDDMSQLIKQWEDKLKLDINPVLVNKGN